MKNRAALSALLAAVLIIPAAAGLAGTPCDLLPTTNKKEISPEKIEGTLCNACVGLPVPGARDSFGNGLDYNDGAKHWECEMHVANRGNGVCKKQTICRPGGDRFFDNGVMRCRYPAVVVTLPGPSNPRDDCERGLRVSISGVKNSSGLPLTGNVVTKPGPVKLLVEGNGIANATSAQIGGGIALTVGDAAGRLGATIRGTCLPPNCQVVEMDNLANAPAGRQTLTLFTPHRYASASVDLTIVDAGTPVVAGDAECRSSGQSSHLKIVLASARAEPGQSIAGNRVEIIGPLPAVQAGKAKAVTLSLHGSFVRVSPATFNVTGPGAFTFSWSNPNQPSQPSNFTKGMVVPANLRQPTFMKCVWARLEGSNVFETVAVGVAAP